VLLPKYGTNTNDADEPPFSDYIPRERDRLNTEREATRTQQRELEQQLAGIDRQFQAVEAYADSQVGQSATTG
jgi:hypothetical protein